MPMYNFAFFGLGVFVATCMAVYQYMNMNNENVQYRQRRAIRSPPRRRRTPAPVKPSSSSCNFCDEPSSTLCRRCNAHYCDSCNGGQITCVVCEAQEKQAFSNCTACLQPIFDCYLVTCNHIHHRDCLIRWFNVREESGSHPQCPICRQNCFQEHISTNFTRPGSLESFL